MSSDCSSPTKEQVESAIERFGNITEASNFLNVSRFKTYRLLKKYSIPNVFLRATDEEIITLIKNFNHENPTGGEKLLTAYLVSKGIFIRRSKLRVLVKLHDVNYEERKNINTNKIVRREYRSPGVNFLWHADGHAKLVQYGIIIHGCIDGFSRYLIYLKASPNNKSVTVSRLMRDAVFEHGVPAHLRVDMGVENRKSAISMHLLRNDVAKPVIVGSSVHNQRQGKKLFFFALNLYN